MTFFGGKTFLVAGGAGFIGQHLVAELIARGAHVIVADNMSTGNAATLRGHEGPALTLLRHDIVEPLDLAVDGILNLACPASPIHYQRDPVATWKASVIGTLNLADLAARRGVRILQASTSEVYGDPLVHPQVETYTGNVNTVGPRSCYDEGKRAAETLLWDYHRTGRAEVRIARIFNTYGPGMAVEDGRVVSTFVNQALRDEPLTVFGEGTQTRSLCYVTDMVAGLLALFAADCGPEPVNLGNPVEINMNELARTIIALTGSRSAIEFRPLPTDDPRVRKPDISRARDRLGWSPQVALHEGLKATISHFAERLAVPA